MPTADLQQMFGPKPTALLGRTSASIIEDLASPCDVAGRLALEEERKGVARAMRGRTAVPSTPLRDAMIELLAWPIATCRTYEEAESLLVATLEWVETMGGIRGIRAASRRHSQAELAYVEACHGIPRGTSTPTMIEIEADMSSILNRNTLYLGLRGEHNLSLRILHGAIGAFFRKGGRHDLLGMTDLQDEDGVLGAKRAS